MEIDVNHRFDITGYRRYIIAQFEHIPWFECGCFTSDYYFAVISCCRHSLYFHGYAMQLFASMLVGDEGGAGVF